MGNANRTLDPNRLLNDRSAVSGGIRLFPAGVSVFGNLRAGFATGARCPGAAINPQAAELYVATTGYWHNSEELTIGPGLTGQHAPLEGQDFLSNRRMSLPL